jgi:Glycosyltransferase family 87
MKRLLAITLAVLASASTWFYINQILRADQIADAAAHHRPRGNLSDLYPRWLGARELLFHRRNPYSADITREIQQGYYGRALDPARAADPNSGEPKDEQAFAYPVYVVFLLAPTVKLPFETVETAFRWMLIALAPLSIFLWLRVLRWKPPCATIVVFCVLSVGWLPMVQGIKLQQLSLLVAALLALSGACLAGGWLFAAGGLLALATIKPQLAWPIVLWLLVWTMADFRARKRFLFGFALVMLLLLGGAEWMLPGWLRMFVAAIGEYHRYTQNQSVMVFMFGAIAGRASELLSILACVAIVWRLRGESPTTPLFGRSFALMLALTVVIVPMFAPYNQVLLVPAILALVWSELSGRVTLPAVRLARRIGAIFLVWPWIVTLALCAAYLWLTPALRHRLWPLPFYSNFLLPIFVFGLSLLDSWMSSPDST